MPDYSPMMQQYLQIKNEHSDCILFFRLGDFYEMFFEDAEVVSRELELVLTGRDCGLPERAPMCGVPYHSYEAYLARLTAKGYKVAICEQMENPAEAKGIVKRKVVRIVTPGTLTESSMLDDTRNNYCASVYEENGCAAVAFADISTGEIWATSIEKCDLLKLQNEIGRYYPREAILHITDSKKYKGLAPFLKDKLFCYITQEKDRFDAVECARALRTQYGENYINESGIKEFPGVISAAGALISYLKETQVGEIPNMKPIGLYIQSQYMEIDINSRRNLEITESIRQIKKDATLLGVLKNTQTAMGGRLLRRWLEQPLCNAAAILRRQRAVAELFENRDTAEDITALLKKTYDLERIMTKVIYASVNCRDLKAMSATFEQIPNLKALLGGCKSAYLSELRDSGDDMQDIYALIESAISDDPPLPVSEGGFIKPGYNAEVDKLREIKAGGVGFISKMEQAEREKTGIKNLKISFNRVFGYYIEITKSNYDLIPDGYIRKQTLANCERFITEELKEYENTVLTANEKLKTLEYELFCALRKGIASNLDRVQKLAADLAALDVLCCFAQVAYANSYVCPEVSFEDVIEIKDGRHPVVEKFLENELFVPNDTRLDCGENRTMIITGPNMAGKSTYMRQVALMAVMAQTGSFVPAAYAKMSIVDKLFTRVGASDDLAAGQSTFMVEMSEMAFILKNATRHSLIILDEIGRGTSTFDGMSIARAVVEHVADKKKLGAKTMFATHYHELTSLEDTLEGIKNYNIAVKKRGDEITFLRKIVRGGADDSYGIEVALLAGVPGRVIERAKVILKELENMDKFASKEEKKIKAHSDQLQMGSLVAEELIERLKYIDLDVLTPLECMQKLYELKKEAEKV